MLNRKFALTISFLIIFLISFPHGLFAKQTAPRTEVKVAEGEVMCIEFPEGIPPDEARAAVFIERISDYICIVDVDGEHECAFIPDRFRHILREELNPDVPVLIYFNVRPAYGTSWDIVGVMKIVNTGNKYMDGEITAASLEEVADILKIVEVETEGVSVDLGTPHAGVDTGVNQAEEVLGEGSGPLGEEAEEEEPIPTEPQPEPQPQPQPQPQPTSYFWVNPSSTQTFNIGNLSIPPGVDSASRNGSDLQPWKTVSYALSRSEVVAGSTINLVGTTFNAGNQGSLPISISSVNSITFTGQGSGSTIFDGGNSNRIFDISSSSSIAFSSLGIQNGSDTGNGGGVRLVGSTGITFSQCAFSSNTASTGGAIYFSGSSTATISGCTFTSNSSTGAVVLGGGAIAVSGTSSATINSDSTFTSNTAAGGGGAISVDNGCSLSISGATTLSLPISITHFSSNTAVNQGGAIFCSSPTSVYLNQLVFGTGADAGKNSAANGGAVYLDSAASGDIIEKCIFRYNEATDAVAGRGGSGVYLLSSDIIVRNCYFDRNQTTGAQGEGALLCDASSATIQQCTFDENTSDNGVGQGIMLNNNSDATITNCILNHTAAARVLHAKDDASDPQVTYSNLYLTPNEATNVGADGDIDDFLPAGWNWTTAPQTNINTDPQLKGTGDYRITNPGSGAVDTGVIIDAVTDDIIGNARGTTGPYDMGCYESSANDDPKITGRIYDSVTGETVSSPVVAIYKKGTTTVLSRTTSNPYTFNVDPGSYFIAVSKSGYGFPSQVVSAKTSGDHGDIFTAGTDALNIDIPVDPDGWLYIEKTVNKKRATAGEIVTYNVKIQNKHWYQVVSNVELVDEIVNGFKYIDNSTYNGALQLSDPTISGRKAVFDIGTVSANSTMNISYQVRVGTCIPYGRYNASAYTRKSTTSERNSNISGVTVEVVDDPLFSKGTIIGKVFNDVDGDGWQDPGETGVSEVKIYTEYGVVVETDEDGKYHIADVPEGNHLLKVDSQSVILSETKNLVVKVRDPSASPQDDTACQFTTDNPCYVKITEGLLAKVNFGITPVILSPEGAKDPELLRQNSSFFIVALAEGTVRDLDTSGNIEMVEEDDRFDDGVHVDGRLAFYLKGKVLGKYLITASLDTERRPGGRYDSRRLFRNLDPDKYYPVYGDASKIDYGGVDTQDIVYVLIEWGESFAKWGSFHTEFPLYKRTLSGGIINYQSAGKTKFGDPWTVIRGFGALSRQKAAHDEFVGTGGSLYYLRHEDVVEGSEKVKVEVKHRISKIVLSSIPLAEEKDYEIDYDSGRILLRRPLNSVQQAYSRSIISNDILMGEHVYLVIDYEYYSDSLSDQAWGIRASQQIGHHIRIGGTYVEEQKTGDPYNVYGGDVTLKFNEDTDINVRYSHSEETQLGSTLSFDGGLTFTEQLDTFSNGEDGDAYNIEGRTILFDNTDIFLSYSKQDPYYSVTDNISQQGSEKYMANITGRITEHLSAGISHITQRYHEETTATQTFGDRDVHVTTGTLDYRRGKWDLRGEYQHQEVDNPVTTYTYFGTLPYLDNDFFAARVGYQLFPWLHPYIRGQVTISGDANDQGTVGADLKLWRDTVINIAETVGTLGNSTLIGLTTKVTEDTDVYANLEVGNNLWLGRYAKSTYGQSTLLGRDSKAYIEEDYSSYRENIVRGSLLGYEKKIGDTLALGLTYERSNVKNNSQAIDRDAGSAALSYLNPDWLKVYTKLEVRNDSGTTEVRQWLTENDILWRVTEGLTLTGRGNWGWTTDLDTETDEAEFYELGAGFSLRPVTWDRLNIIGKYSYLTNLPPDSQWDFPESTESRRHVYAIEGAFDLFRYLQLVGKFAYCDMDEKVGYRGWTQSNTYLYIARTNFHVMNAEKGKPFMLRGWDLGVEYRILANAQIEDSKEGFLVELDKDVGNYLRLGVGYNFTDYDDDLRNSDDWDAEGWFVRMTGKY